MLHAQTLQMVSGQNMWFGGILTEAPMAVPVSSPNRTDERAGAQSKYQGSLEVPVPLGSQSGRMVQSCFGCKVGLT